MKHKNTAYFTDCPAYPGAASHRYFIGKLLETITGIASGVGFLTVLLFFLLL